ncbi:dihydrofolate reductase [Terrarubrum flagellatum]|uniref:dihydrofolate reductase n=1 Tax=Terrirubrum flagellatum TaxID=2895980 RepID=UPI0031451D6F
MTPPAIVLVAAMGRNRVIGRDNAMPWRLPTDLKRYRALTMGKPMVMGRKTFLSIGRVLPGRESIVLTRDASFAPPAGVHVVATLDEALALGAERAVAMGADEIIIAGGGEVYAQTIGMADRLHITEVDATPEGDAVFPIIDPALFREIHRESHSLAPPDAHAFTFVDYARK